MRNIIKYDFLTLKTNRKEEEIISHKRRGNNKTCCGTEQYKIETIRFTVTLVVETSVYIQEVKTTTLSNNIVAVRIFFFNYAVCKEAIVNNDNPP